MNGVRVASARTFHAQTLRHPVGEGVFAVDSVAVGHLHGVRQAEDGVLGCLPPPYRAYLGRIAVQVGPPEAARAVDAAEGVGSNHEPLRLVYHPRRSSAMREMPET